MLMNDGLMRIFWPLDSIKPEVSGTLVGWKNSQQDVFVTSILQGAEPRVVEHALRLGHLFRNSPYPVDHLMRRCGQSSLAVLGELNPRQDHLADSTSTIFVYSKGSKSFPRVFCSSTEVKVVQFITYERPRPSQMQFVSLDPIALALNRSTAMSQLYGSASSAAASAENIERKRLAGLVQKMRLHTVVEHPRTPKELSLTAIIEQINCSYELDRLLQKNSGLVRKRQKRKLSVSERIVESSTDFLLQTNSRISHTIQVYVRPYITMLFVYCYMAHRAVAEAVLLIVEWRFKPNMLALKDISATAQQVDLRLQQFCYWPIQSLTLRERREDWKSITNSHPEYIRFFNNLWLVANDVILGIAIGSFILENADFVATEFDKTLGHWSLAGLQQMISWLMDNPGGLKLNTELAGFFGDLFLWVIDYWAGCVVLFQPLLPKIIRFVGFTSFGGATMTLSLVSDFVSLLTVHIHCFYVASARIYNWQLTIIISLFHLFRGKKRNVLRHRIDSCDYELDQLLLGTILFTLLTFLLPTVLVFYLTFAVARMGIISLRAVLDTALAGLNHFPLFALMLRIKDSRRIPGGVRFELRDTPSEFILSQDSTTLPTSFIALKSKPLTLRAIFHEYFQFGNRIKSHYLSPKVLGSFATGGFVPPLQRKNLYGLQYNMLPAKRVSITVVWNRLLSSTAAASVNGDGRNSTKVASNGHVSSSSS